jgi:arabinose-5-phosphate isomerase
LVDARGVLKGIFTDSDLARLMERQLDAAFDQPISEVMTKKPVRIRVGSQTTQAVKLLAKHNISELPVVDQVGRAVGMIDITDVITLMPTDVPKPTRPQPLATPPPRPTIRLFQEAKGKLSP